MKNGWIIYNLLKVVALSRNSLLEPALKITLPDPQLRFNYLLRLLKSLQIKPIQVTLKTSELMKLIIPRVSLSVSNNFYSQKLVFIS